MLFDNVKAAFNEDITNFNGTTRYIRDVEIARAATQRDYREQKVREACYSASPLIIGARFSDHRPGYVERN